MGQNPASGCGARGHDFGLLNASATNKEGLHRQFHRRPRGRHLPHQIADLSVKVPGGNVSCSRHYERKAWHDVPPALSSTQAWNPVRWQPRPSPSLRILVWVESLDEVARAKKSLSTTSEAEAMTLPIW